MPDEPDQEEKLTASITGPDGVTHEIPEDVAEVMFGDLEPDQVQLSLEVLPHPAIDVVHGKGLIAGTIKLKGELRCKQDFNAGDEFTISVADADGTVVAVAQAEQLDPPNMKTITDKEIGPIGTERIHTVQVTKDLLT